MLKGTVVYIGGFELPDKNAAAHRVLNNGKILRDLGYNVVFIGIDKDLTYYNDVLNTKNTVQGFDCWYVPYPKSKHQWIQHLTNTSDFSTVMCKYTDVKMVVCYNYPSVALIRIKHYCRSKRIKIVADCTEWHGTDEGEGYIYKVIKASDVLLRMRVVHPRLDGLIVISQYLENHYKNNAVVRIPPLVDVTEEKWNQPVPEYDDDMVRFVYAGSPGKNKDKLYHLLEALGELDNYSNYIFHIVGISKEQYLLDHNEHKKLLEELGHRVVFLGRLPHDDSLKYIKMADLSLFIRDDTRATRAGFPTKFVESWSCGTPVITTKSSDLEGYILDGVNGFFLNLQQDDLYKCIKKILQMDKAEIKKIRNPSINRTFDYRNYIEQIRNHIDVITAGGKG